MRFSKQKFLYIALRFLIYGKRAAATLGKGLVFFFRFLGRGWRQTFGFRLERLVFLGKKYFHISSGEKPSSFLGWLGRRRTLEGFLFLIGVLLIIPHSRFIAKSEAIPGRNTLLYQLVGPGDEEGSTDTFIDVVDFSLPNNPSWVNGIIMKPEVVDVVPDSLTAADRPVSLSVDSTAIHKPVSFPNSHTSPTPNETAETEVRRTVQNYQVRSGDTLAGIAKKYGIKIDTLLSTNKLTAKTSLRVGQTLVILPTDGVVHIVKSGETLGAIARKYNVVSNSIITFNNLPKQGAALKIGTQLIIPGAVPIKTVASIPIVPVKVPAGRPLPTNIPVVAGGYIWPSGSRYISQYFTWRHNGLDIAGPIGTPIRAAKGGVVTFSGCNRTPDRLRCHKQGYYGYGCYVVIDHGGGLSTLYGHNSQLLVEVGETVEQGQLIAYGGSTGNSSGPHLHFEVRIGKVRQNPLRYVR